MFVQHRSLCLASSSPRRQEFLRRYQLEFDCHSPQVDESQKTNEPVEEYVKRIAMDKAQNAEESFPNAIILAGDTIVFLNRQILGKPENAEHARQMLQQLSGQSHTVYSAYVILDSSSKKVISEVTQTEVFFQSLTSECIQLYVQTKEPMDKAGAYSIQGMGAMLVASIKGSYNSVVGFPVEQILPHLIQEGWISYKE